MSTLDPSLGRNTAGSCLRGAAAALLALIGAAADPLLAQTVPAWQKLCAEIDISAPLDLDRDGIFDAREAELGTDPRSADSDRDGFGDAFEAKYRQFGFDPLRPDRDSDRDGLTDELEAEIGTAQRNPDSDGDGLADFDEYAHLHYGYDPLEPTEDADFDGLADVLEVEIGTSPERIDSDGDGASDFRERESGTDPASPFEGEFGELIGTTYGERIAEALRSVRAGERFGTELIEQLPYPELSDQVFGDPELGLAPSAALIEQAVSILDGLNEPYPGYNDIVSDLFALANRFDGNPDADIACLYRFTVPTYEGRHIYALKISDNPGQNEDETEVLYMGLHHGRELISATVSMNFAQTVLERYAAGDSEIVDLVHDRELWVIPVVNPDGYARAIGQDGAHVSWRKNTRPLSEPATTNGGQAFGVDPNRNYGFEHIRTIPAGNLPYLGNGAWEANGIDIFGAYAPQMETYAGQTWFSEIETLAVRGLVSDVFTSGSEVGGIACSLSWHSFGGYVIYPMLHATSNGMASADRYKFDRVTDAVVGETGYNPIKDAWPQSFYPVYGGAADWLYKEKDIVAITVEIYSSEERNGSGPKFFPEDGLTRWAVSGRNVAAGVAFGQQCCNPCRIDSGAWLGN